MAGTPTAISSPGTLKASQDPLAPDCLSAQITVGTPPGFRRLRTVSRPLASSAPCSSDLLEGSFRSHHWARLQRKPAR